MPADEAEGSIHKMNFGRYHHQAVTMDVGHNDLAEKWQRLAVQVANSPSSQQAQQPQRTQNSN
jgi:hypothetical protein